VLGAKRLSHLEEALHLPSPLLAEVGLVGISSLARIRRQIQPGERKQVAAPLTDDDRETSLREMEKNLRNALRLDRANRFVDRLELEPGEKVVSADLPVSTEDDILDVVSCLVFASAGGANYRVTTKREETPNDPVIHDEKAGFGIERFEVEKK
jgi:hypothetical protein